MVGVIRFFKMSKMGNIVKKLKNHWSTKGVVWKKTDREMGKVPPGFIGFLLLLQLLQWQVSSRFGEKQKPDK